MAVIARFSLLCILLALCGNGCREQKPPPIPSMVVPMPMDPPSGPSEQTARQILDKMVAAYKSATSYADHGTVRIVGKLAQPESEPISWPCTVAFQAPGNLRLEVNEGMLVSDGVDVFAQVRRLSGQVLTFPTPPRWTLDILFKDAYLDEAMNLAFPKDIVAFPPQVVLLFADNPLKTFLPEGAVAELFDAQQIEERRCDIVQVTHRDKKRILWVDQETGALLRLDYLVEGLPLPPGVESIRLIRIDMSDAAFDARISPDAFEMYQPAGATQVDEFRPVESTWLGEVIKDPQKIVLNRFPLMETDEAESVALSDLTGKTIVFCFWTTWSEPSRSALVEMQKIRETLATDEQVQFFAVNLDTPPNESELRPTIEKTFTDWALSIPIDRPTDLEPLDELGIDSFPTLLVVGPNGCVEFFFRGIVQAATLGKIVRDIQNGGKPHEEGLVLFELEKAGYRRILESMVVSDCFALLSPLSDPPQPSEIAPFRLPTTLKLTERWELQEVKNPGNIAVLPGTGGATPTLLLPCEGNCLAMLDLDGNIIKKEKPPGLQTDELLNIVRVGVNGDKRYIGVSSIGGRTVHILDDSLETILSYSPNKQPDNLNDTPKPEQIIADFRLTDLQGNGAQTLLISLLSLDETAPPPTDSLRAIDLQGRELWHDETIASPFQVEVFSNEGRQEVLAIHAKQQQGSLLRLDSHGKQLGELVLEGERQIRWFDCIEPNHNGPLEIAAILVSPTDGSSQVAGIDEAGKILWSVPIPPGEPSTPIEMLGIGDINGDGVTDWIVPTVDGVILFIDRNGKVIDSFATGRTLSGVALLPWENRRLLVIADAETVKAWTVD